MQWEYKVIISKNKTKGFINPTLETDTLEKQLNLLGMQNWELVNSYPIKVIGGGTQMQAVFKRPR